MLKANVGLSRKISRDYQSTGYTVNIEGEIPAPVQDPELVLAKVKELFNLAEAALDAEIDRDQGEQAIGRHDMEPAPRQPASDPSPADRPVKAPAPPPPRPTPPANNHTSRPNNSDAATPKQLEFIRNLGKRQKLSSAQMDTVVAEALGHARPLQELSKKEAGAVIEALNGDSASRNGSYR